jgi:hypothetical protein
MAWEDLVKKQTDRLTTLLDDVVVRWRNAKAKTGTVGGYTADELANDLASIWPKVFDYWWGPFNAGTPVVPTLFMTSPPSNAGPVTRDVRLANDTTTAKVTITELGLLGGGASIGTADIAHAVTEGSKLSVSVSNVPALVAKSANIYQGLALEGNEPIAVVVLRVV